MACIVLPSYQEEFVRVGHCLPIKNWIDEYLDCSELIFFKKQGVFNIGWSENIINKIDIS